MFLSGRLLAVVLFPGAAGAGTAEPAQGLPLPGCGGGEGAHELTSCL